MLLEQRVMLQDMLQAQGTESLLLVPSLPSACHHQATEHWVTQQDMVACGTKRLLLVQRQAATLQVGSINL